jgi:hypothetical protein
MVDRLRLLAEFATSADLVAALRQLQADGHRRLEAYTPVAVPEVEEALGQGRSRLPLAVFAVGITAAGGAYFLQWLLVAKLYPLDVGGRPPHFPLAFLIISFEMGILAAALTAFAGVMVRGRLVRLVDEVQGTAGFESASRDRFWLELWLDRRDGMPVDAAAARERLTALGALRVEAPDDPQADREDDPAAAEEVPP